MQSPHRQAIERVPLSSNTPDIYFSRYRLKSRAHRLNAASPRREFEGALIQVGEGFACLHPWQELGDPSLDKCLADLQGKRRWPIVRRALRCAELDGAARVNEDWMFEEMEVPRSHFTLPLPDRDQVALALENGFDTIKLKVGQNLVAEGLFLREASADHPTLRWRLDANEKPTREDIRDFLLSLPEAARDQIEFIEDPCPFSEEGWQKLHRETRVPLAIDRESAPNLSTAKSAQVVIVKPALDEPWLLAESAAGKGQRVVVTSYMDHPLGQAFAAWEAGRLSLQFPGLVGTCGLQTHGLFEPNPFTEALGSVTPEFHPVAWTGLGFDELLDTLLWQKL
ncbi:enolase C-terminal domain-like protein [Roseibacillus persicicus]|uniref:enolase C-terminal domain-like protein n=1 Tax=Roseibacillus persicicus TaxID=454148 RepID=UPI00398A9C95